MSFLTLTQGHLNIKIEIMVFLDITGFGNYCSLRPETWQMQTTYGVNKGVWVFKVKVKVILCWLNTPRSGFRWAFSGPLVLWFTTFTQKSEGAFLMSRTFANMMEETGGPEENTDLITGAHNPATPHFIYVPASPRLLIIRINKIVVLTNVFIIGSWIVHVQWLIHR